MEIALLALVAFTFCKCRYRNSNNAELVRQLNTTEVFTRDTAVPWSIRFLRLAQRDLALDSLIYGFDSLQIRIWNGCARDYRSGRYWLIGLILDREGWKAEFSDLFVEHFDHVFSSGRHDSLTRKVSERHPYSGWHQFITKLFKLKILSLPDFEKIKNDQDNRWNISDGCGITIEIASKKSYRVYSYETPDVFMQHWEVKNIIKILELIEVEFGINKVKLF